MKRILIVDDDDLVRETIDDILSSVGYDIHTEGSAQSALRWLEKNKCDAVITDVIMPDMDGIEFTTKLRALGAPMKIITISGGSEILQKDFVLTSAKYLGADETLSKPINNDALVKAVHRVVG